jgi:hypothetical protein
MSATLKSLKDLLWTGLCVIGFGLLLWNLPTLLTASQTLLQRASSISTIEVEGVKLSFDQGSVSSQLVPFKVSPSDQAKVLETVHGLEPDQFERLMNVGQLFDLCDFEHPTTEMRRQSAVDYELKEKGLASITESRHLRDEVEEKIKIGEISSGKLSDIGYPRSCYFLRLTDVGFNTKTAIVSILSRAFDPRIAMK